MGTKGEIMSPKVAFLGSQLALAGGILLLTIGCGHANPPANTSPKTSILSDRPEDLVGQFCVIHLRYDALGTAGESPKPAFTDVMNGSTVSIRGTLQNMDNNWVVISQELESSTQVHWVPVNAILSVTLSKPTEDANSHAGHGDH